MSRVEEKNTKVENLEDEINRLKRGLKRKENKRFFSCGNCLITVLVVAVVVGFYFAYLVALTGLWHIPFFSQKFYTEPQPSYQVDDSSITAKQKDIIALLQQEVTQAGISLNKLGDFNVFMTLSDQQLTAIARDQIADTETMSQKIEYAQIAILEENIEFFIKAKEPSNFIFTINVEPRIKNDNIDLKVVEFKLGLLRLPNFLANISVAYFSEKGINSFLNMFEGFGQIRKIDLHKGELILEIFIKDIKLII